MKEDIISTFIENGKLSIIGFDVDKIQEYVFATSKPMEIGGASEIIRGLNKETISNWLKSIDSRLNNENIVYAHGGGGLIISAPSKADEIVKRVEDEFHKTSIIASLTAEKIDVQSNELQNNFSRIFKTLQEKLRFKKDLKNAFAHSNLQIPPYFKRCSSCGIYPVTQYDKNYRDEEEKHICNSCFNKRNKFRKEMSDMSLTLKDIVKEDSKEEDLAIIYADGHNTGSILETLTLSEFSEIPERFYEITRSVLHQTIKELKLKNKFLAPIIGGDDILLILPAKKSILALGKIIEKFKNEVNSIPKLKDISLDVGLVIAHHHFPIRYLFQYANALMKNAKKLAYQKEKKDEKFIFDYMVIKGGSPLNISIDELRRIELLKATGGIEYRLTRKPYKWDEFNDKIIKSLKELTGFPSSQLYIVLEHLLEHPEVAKLNIMYQVIRSADWKAKLKAITGVNNLSHWQSFFIEKVSVFQYETSFFDLMELYKIKVEV